MADKATKPEEMPSEAELDALLAPHIDRLVEQRVTAALAKVSAAVPSAANSEMAGFIQSLAMEFATLSDQGTGRKRVAPEEMVKREKARARMEELIATAREAGDLPTYELRHMVYFGETKIPSQHMDSVSRRMMPTQIGWALAPNEGMRPLNEVAKAIHSAYLESIGSTGTMELGQMRVTANGLQILKRAPEVLPEADHTGAHRTGPRSNNGGPEEGVILGPRGGQGPVVEQRILGTLMPAARQSA